MQDIEAIEKRLWTSSDNLQANSDYVRGMHGRINNGMCPSLKVIEVNVQIMRAFVKLREMLSSHKDLARKLADMEKKYDSQFKVVFDAIRQLMSPSVSKKGKIGFKREKDA
jgi:hypothetical protein